MNENGLQYSVESTRKWLYGEEIKREKGESKNEDKAKQEINRLIKIAVYDSNTPKSCGHL